MSVCINFTLLMVITLTLYSHITAVPSGNCLCAGKVAHCACAKNTQAQFGRVKRGADAGYWEDTMSRSADNMKAMKRELESDSDQLANVFRWGKRNEPQNAVFRWGKRSPEKDSLQENGAYSHVFRWGKRDENAVPAQRHQGLGIADAQDSKRLFRWGKRSPEHLNSGVQNLFRWGKRADSPLVFRWGKRSDNPLVFRWGKRGLQDNDALFRWGKRAPEVGSPPAFRWGKRAYDELGPHLNTFNPYDWPGKRIDPRHLLNDDGYASVFRWGKRTDETMDTNTRSFLRWGKRAIDEKLDDQTSEQMS